MIASIFFDPTRLFPMCHLIEHMNSLVEALKNGKLFEAELMFHAFWAASECPPHIMESIKLEQGYNDTVWANVESQINTWKSCYKD